MAVCTRHIPGVTQLYRYEFDENEQKSYRHNRIIGARLYVREHVGVTVCPVTVELIDSDGGLHGPFHTRRWEKGPEGQRLGRKIMYRPIPRAVESVVEGIIDEVVPPYTW